MLAVDAIQCAVEAHGGDRVLLATSKLVVDIVAAVAEALRAFTPKPSGEIPRGGLCPRAAMQGRRARGPAKAVRASRSSGRLTECQRARRGGEHAERKDA